MPPATPPQDYYSDKKRKDSLARTFSNLMLKGKTGAALDLLSRKGASDGVLHVNDPVSSEDSSSHRSGGSQVEASNCPTCHCCCSTIVSPQSSFCASCDL